MEAEQINALQKMFEYNRWANERLITICAGLDENQLGIEVEVVFGQIRPTLVHQIRSEGGYAGRLAGKRLWPDDLAWDQMSFEQLLEKSCESGDRLIEICTQADPAKKHEEEHLGLPIYFFNWTVLLQALYHGIEHRTQIKILLTQLGVEHPDLAAWDYVESLPVNGHRDDL